jgi:hypothetical protein
MSLNWNASTLSENLLRYKTRYNGTEDEDMSPVLHRLIFLTMTLCEDLSGKQGKKADVKKRIAYIAKVSPDLITLSFGDEAPKGEVWNGTEWVPFLDYWKPKTRYHNGKVDGYDVTITAETIDLYWGLSTNASRKTFSKWFKDFNKRTLELMGR